MFSARISLLGTLSWSLATAAPAHAQGFSFEETSEGLDSAIETIAYASEAFRRGLLRDFSSHLVVLDGPAEAFTTVSTVDVTSSTLGIAALVLQTPFNAESALEVIDFELGPAPSRASLPGGNVPFLIRNAAIELESL
ncbi:MAG: hypothetical protein AAFZ65_05270 [Planctomycetota bacterium]